MSDEEKEAIGTLKSLKDIKWYEHAFDNGTEVLEEEEKQDIDIVLNLIEKQQKEIEELKKPKYLLNAKTGEITTINNSEFISKDKIKAKVIEIKNRPVKDEFITATQGKLNTIIEIESLLEKE